MSSSSPDRPDSEASASDPFATRGGTSPREPPADPPVTQGGAGSTEPPADLYLTQAPQEGAARSAAPFPDFAQTQLLGSGETLSPRPPKRIGDYELQRELGRGGMGVVYQARDCKLKRLVALKMIRAGVGASHADVERFLAETRAAARLDHPGIVPVYEIGLIRMLRLRQPLFPFQDYSIPASNFRFLDFTPFVSPDGRYLLTQARGSGAQVIDLKSGKPAGEILENSGVLFQGAFLAHRSRVVIQTRQSVQVWDWQTGQTVWGPIHLPAAGYFVDASPTGNGSCPHVVTGPCCSTQARARPSLS